jgi:endonuclease/exonuclease/phosphatase family metal-dependent hydrolase
MTLILTYNIKWDANKTQVKNILLNIQKILNTYDIDFLLFQEASIYEKLIYLIDNKKYDYHLNRSGPEYMITFYKKSYKKINAYDSEFSSGRPFCIFIFKNIISKEKFYLTNIHAGHHPNTDLSIIKPIIEITKNLDNNTNTFIIGGDFNRNIINNIYIETKNNNFKIKNIHSNLKTCCGIDKNKFKQIYDHIISSSKIIKKITFNDYSPSSDHIMVIVELEDI